MAQDDQYGLVPASGGTVDATYGLAPASTVESTLQKTSGISAPPKPWSAEWFKQGLWRAAAATADAMPAIGGTLGAMAGAPEGPLSAVGGAGVGGAGGEAAKQIAQRALGYPNVPQTSGQAAQDITKQGAIQGAIQGVTEALPLVAPGLKSSAATQYERALAPTTQVNKAIAKKITPELINRGEYGSLQSLSGTAQENLAELNPQLNQAYAATAAGTTKGGGTQVIQDLEDLKNQYMVAGKVADPQAVSAISGVQDVVRQFGPDIPPDDLRKLKSIFDDPVAKAGGYAGADLSTAHTLQAREIAANSIRNIMATANPDVAALNKQINFWLNVQKVTNASMLRQTGQAGGLTKVLSPLATAVAGGAGLAHGPETAALAASTAALAATAAQVGRSAAWRTGSAVAKDAFANALARGDVGAVTALAARFGVAATGPKTQDAQQTPSPNQ